VSGTSITSRSPDRRRQVELLASRRAGRGVALGQRIERVRQSDQSFGFVPQRVVGRPVRDDHPIAQRLEVALQVGQRGAQLVGRVGDEIAPHHLLALQAGGHLVERIGEAGDLLRPFSGDARRVVAVGDPAGGGAHFGERPREHPREDDRKRHAGDDRHHDRGDDHGRDRAVVHRLGVVGRDAGLGHQRAEDIATDHGHTDGQDGQPDGRRGERRQCDPRRDAAPDHVRAAR
jgi:hypothetical protein